MVLPVSIYAFFYLTGKINEERSRFMQKNLIEKIKESLGAVLPVAAVVFLLSVTVVPLSGEMFFSFYGKCSCVIGGIRKGRNKA